MGKAFDMSDEPERIEQGSHPEREEGNGARTAATALVAFGTLALLFAAAVVVFLLIAELTRGQWMLAGSAVVAVLAMRPFTDGAYHSTWGDRKDGRLIRTLSPMNIVAGYIMPTRNDACNSIQTTFEISKVERYIRQKRAEGMESFGLTHVLLAAYVRCIAKYPGVNRFFSGQRVYQRDDDVQFTMTIKKDMRTDGEETTIKLHLKPTDTTTLEDCPKRVFAVKGRKSLQAT